MTKNEVLIKTPEEAIETIKSNMPTSGYQMLRESLEMAISSLKEIQQYREIGTMEECRKAVEKQKPMEPDYEGDGYADGYMVYDTWICPNCEHRFETDSGNYLYCPNCGQKIILEESEEE